ncbi:MAG: SpoIIE family protein phosphatase [Rikenellaceae bacterium]
MKSIKKSLSTRLSVYIVSIVTTLFALSFAIYFLFAERTIKEDAYRQAELELDKITSTIDAKLALVEQSVHDAIFPIEQNMGDYDAMIESLHNMVSTNPIIYGASLAFEPNYFPDQGKFFMPYIYRESDKIQLIWQGNDDYNYHVMDWYIIPKLLNKSYWSEPYYDGVFMTTYTVPLRDEKENIIGVITADLSLELLTNLVVDMKPYKNSYAVMISRNGYYLAHNDSSLVLNDTFFTHTQELDSNSSHAEIRELGKQMKLLNSGNTTISINGNRHYAFYSPITRTGWSIVAASRVSDVLSDLRSMAVKVWSVLLLGLIVIFIFVWIVVRRITSPLKQFTKTASIVAQGEFNTPLPEIATRDEVYDLREAFINMQHSLKEYIEELHSTTKARERIESELEIATTIQMGMLPTIFPPHPNLPDVDLFAALIPAKEVGGDLYDFFVSGGKLYFTVGDASGKGVPASLLMAVTSSLFRSVAAHIGDPAKILYNINNSIAETNDANMFITLFVGELNLTTGELIYSSAGHNAPVLLRNGEATFIDVVPALPLGAMSDIEYSNHTMRLDSSDTLLLYSDGLTEAENREQELYSDERLLECMMAIAPQSSAATFIAEIKQSVDLFVGENEQSDDLTMLVLKPKERIEMKRELIIKNEISELNRLAEFIEMLGDERGFDPALTMNLNLALEEAISNIILYAYPEKMGELINIACVDIGGTLIFTISDSGVEFDPTQVEEADVTLSAEERGIGGLGIYLIRQIMDDVKYQRIENKNVLTIKKKL